MIDPVVTKDGARTNGHALDMRGCANLARFDLVSIRLAVFCAETGTLSGAARHTNMSLSRASHRLARLEDMLGRRLFERHAHGLKATEAGRVLVEHGRGLLRAVDQMNVELGRRPGSWCHSMTVP